MLHKSPKRNAVRLIKKGVIAITFFEVAALGLSYLFYHRVNSNRDFRFYLHQNHPWVLDKYYSLGEYFSKENSARQLDLEFWSREQNIK